MKRRVSRGSGDLWPRIPDRRFSPLDLPSKTHSGFNGCLSIKAGLRNAIF